MQTIHNFFPAERCQELIVLTEKYIRDEGNRQCSGEKLPDYYIFQDQKLADEIWSRLKDEYKLLEKYTDEKGDEFEASGIEANMNILRYKPGYAMGKHCDYEFDRGYQRKNPVTLVIYLNTIEPQNGGITLFTDSPDVKISSEQGKAFLFVTHEREHQVTQLLRGFRYVLVTRIVYTLSRCKNEALLAKIYNLKKEIDLLFDEKDFDIKKLQSKTEELYKCQLQYSSIDHCQKKVE
jgi:hypothetical protein